MIRRVSILSLALLFVSLLVAPPATAHDATGTPGPTTGFYYHRWRHSTTARWRVTPGFKNVHSNARTLAQYAGRTWHDAQSGLSVSEISPWTANFDPQACPQTWSTGSFAYQKNGVHYRSVGARGVTYECVGFYPGTTAFREILSSNIVLDSTLPSGTWNWLSTSPSSSQWDAWATLAHEFGHFTGFIRGGGKLYPHHFMSGRSAGGVTEYWDTSACPGGTSLPNRVTNSTMCDSGWGKGEYWGITLEPHDRQTAENAY